MTIRIKNRGEWNEYYVHSESGWSFEIDRPLDQEIVLAQEAIVAYTEYLAFLEDKAQTREALKDLANLPRTELPQGGLKRLAEFDAQFVPGPVIEALTEVNPGVWSRILGDR